MSTQERIMDWYRANSRDLPWRTSEVTAWQILVSEIMLQQTPAARVAPAWLEWIARWPDAQSLAQASPADVLRQWNRLGYPNRALRLHATAQEVVNRFSGQLPQDFDELRSLPGIGEYTAAAIMSFAFNKRAVVLDTNVRRVIARVWHGNERTPSHLTTKERQEADGLVPTDDASAALWSIAVMEFGAVVCTSRTPQCHSCIISSQCTWHLQGHPAFEGVKRTQKFTGTDRQVRGKIMAALRESTSGVTRDTLTSLWPHATQRSRALSSLIEDGLVEQNDDGTFQLPN
ncbi:MAG: A/G-specific adenine glycosylase [Actinobacteria bacterium]|nr:A/G-specific adenine glycosylase [Actinomycetota bacterium]